MIQEAFISGQLGKAIYLDRDAYFLVDNERPEVPVECRPIDVSSFFSFNADLTRITEKDLNLQKIRAELQVQSKSRLALIFIVSGMDRELDEDVRSSGIVRAEELLTTQSARRFVTARMLARALPLEADIEGASRLATELGASVAGEIYQNIVSCRDSINAVLKTWREAAVEYFSSDDQRIEAEKKLTDLGAFADATVAVATQNRTALNAFVVNYGQNAELRNVFSPLFLNDFKGRLLKQFKADLSSLEKDRSVIPESEAQGEDRHSIRDVLAGFRKWGRRGARFKRFKPDEAKERVDHQIEAITKLILQGNTNRAHRYLNDLINFHVEHSARRHLGMSLCALAKVAIDNHSFDLAERMVDYALMLGIDDVVIFNTQAEMFKAMGAHDRALAVYEETIESFPNNEVARNGYAEVLKAIGKYDESLAVYEETIERFPNNEITRSGYAEVLKALGRYEESLAVYLEIIERFPNNQIARNGYAEVLKALGKYDESLAVYEQTIERFPNNEVARNGYAEVLKAIGRHDGALAVYKETIERFPNNDVAPGGYAELLKTIGEYEQALSVYDETKQRFPNDVFAWSGHAEVLKALGKYDESLAVYEQTIERFPNSEVARDGYAEVLKALGRYDESLAVYLEIIERFPNNKIAANGYAEVLKAMGKYEEALSVYAKTKQRFPNDVFAWSGHAEVLKAIGKYDEALAAYKATFARFPNNAVVRNGYANILVFLKRFDEARQLLPQTAPRDAEDWIAYHILALSYLREGNVDEAISRLAYGWHNAVRSEQDYFATALAVAQLRKRDFAEVPKILASNVTSIDFVQRQARLLLLSHSQAGMGKRDEAARTLNQVKGTINPQVVSLKEAIERRYRLGRSSAVVTGAEALRLESRIYDQEFLLAA